MTYSALKPKESDLVKVMYRGPMRYVRTHSGIILPPGLVRRIPEQEAGLLGEQVFVMDESGNVTNTNKKNTCACFLSPEEEEGKKQPKQSVHLISNVTRMSSGCMACGAPLLYLSEERKHDCAFCDNTFSVNSLCENGHFVCDACHAEDGLKVIRHICTVTRETDMIRLFQHIREHPSIPVNGPEHHALVPGVILASYSHLGGDVSVSTIETGIKRGSSVAGGYCAFMGICGAAVGVGIAFSLILDSNPLKPDKRKIVQSAANAVLTEIAAFEAARCCQRDSLLALKKAADLSKELLPIALKAEGRIKCTQKKQNKECLGRTCPMY